MRQSHPLIRVGISACLLGERVRYDGGHRRNGDLAGAFSRFIEWVPVCPEVELGLGVPRETLRLEGDPSNPRMIGTESRTDHTEAMLRYARHRMDALGRENLCGYVFKKGSPSCGLKNVPVYRRSEGRASTRGRRVLQGKGLFARSLGERFPELPMEDEFRLADSSVRESFVRRIFACQRWHALLEERLTVRRLEEFHRRHRLLLGAHAPRGLRELEELLALAGKLPRRPPGKVLGKPTGRLSRRQRGRRYARAFMAILATPATARGHARALKRAMTPLAPRLNSSERRLLTEAIAGYLQGSAPLWTPLDRLARAGRRLGIVELEDDWYLHPDPREARLLRLASRGSSR